MIATPGRQDRDAYTLGGERFSYTGQSESDILGNASREVYNIDEGAAIGAVDRNILIGGATPVVVEENSFANPLKEVKVIQTIYASLGAEDIVTRVQNCNHPDGPVDMTLKDAKKDPRDLESSHGRFLV
jgi:hypothetical protein